MIWRTHEFVNWGAILFFAVRNNNDMADARVCKVGAPSYFFTLNRAEGHRCYFTAIQDFTMQSPRKPLVLYAVTICRFSIF